MSTRQLKKHVNILIAFMSLLFLLSCEHKGGVSDERNTSLKILHSSIIEDSSGQYIVICFKNISDANLVIESTEIIDSDSNIVKLSSNVISPSSVEYCVLKCSNNDLANSDLSLKLNKNGTTFIVNEAISNTLSSLAKSVTLSSDLGIFYIYFTADPWEDTRTFKCYINDCEEHAIKCSRLPLTNSQSIVCLEVKSSKKLLKNSRYSMQIVGEDDLRVAWCGKLFSPYYIGLSQHAYFLRVVRIEEDGNWLNLLLYNESDYSKKPVRIDRVTMNGIDITSQCQIPTGYIPPDMHRYEEDTRCLSMPLPWYRGNTHIVEIAYHLLPGLRTQYEIDNTTHYYRFTIKKGLPLVIGEWGGPSLKGCVCAYFEGLRPSLSSKALNDRAKRIRKLDPFIPLYVRIQDDVNDDRIKDIMLNYDFLVVAPPVGVSNQASFMLKDFINSLEKSNDSLMSSVVFSVGQYEAVGNNISPDDYKWLAITSLAYGSKGVIYRNPSKARKTDIVKCKADILLQMEDLRILENIQHISYNIDLMIEYDQLGTIIKSQMAGPDRIIIYLINSWCSRASRRLQESFYAMPKQSGTLRIHVGENWTFGKAYNLFTSKEMHARQDDNIVSLKVAGYSIVQAVVLETKNVDTEYRLPGKRLNTFAEDPPPVPSLIPVNNPFIDLGDIQSKSSHMFSIALKNSSSRDIEVMAKCESDHNSKPGKLYFLPCKIPSHSQGIIKGEIVPTNMSGYGLNKIHIFESDNPDCGFYVYLDFNTYSLFDVIPSIVYFGTLANVSDKGNFREIRFESTRTTDFWISDIRCKDYSINTQIGKDRKSFIFCPTPIQKGSFNSELVITLICENKEHTLEIPFHGEYVDNIFVRPKKIYVNQLGDIIRRKIKVNSIEKVKIKYISSDLDGLEYTYINSNYSNEHFITIEIPSHEVGQYKVQIVLEDEHGMNEEFILPIEVFGKFKVR